MTASGSISYSASAEAEGRSRGNSIHMAVFSTIPARERGSRESVSQADLLVKTESGSIVVKKAD